MQPCIFLGLITLGMSFPMDGMTPVVGDCNCSMPFGSEALKATLFATHLLCFLMGRMSWNAWDSGTSDFLKGKFVGVFGHGFTPMYHFSEERGHTLTLDIGAASNLTGSSPILEYEQRVLIPRGMVVDRWEEHGSFTGISGKPVFSEDAIQIPAALGQGLPLLEYIANCLRPAWGMEEMAKLPSLMSLQAMRSLGWRLFMDKDCLYVPDPSLAADIYANLDLIHTGYHYELRIDQYEEGPGPFPRYRITVEEVGNSSQKPETFHSTANQESGDEGAESSGEEEGEKKNGKFRNLFREMSIGVLQRKMRELHPKERELLAKRAQELAVSTPKGPPPPLSGEDFLS